MKYIKKFKHITELNSMDNFIFAINIKNATKEDIEKLYKMSSDYFYDFESFNDYNYFMYRINEKKIKPWALVYNMYDSINGINTSVSFIENTGWGKGYKYMDDIITLDEFFEVGFDNVEEYINTKSNAEKFNL